MRGVPIPKGKRVLLTVPVELHTVLKRWSKATGKPMATLITEMLEEQQVLLSGMVSAFEAAKQGKEVEARKSLMQMAGGALQGLGRMMKR